MARPAREARRLDRALFPHGTPDLPATLQEHHDRLDMRYATGVLVTHGDLTRRRAAEAGVPLPGCRRSRGDVHGHVRTRCRCTGSPVRCAPPSSDTL